MAQKKRATGDFIKRGRGPRLDYSWGMTWNAEGQCFESINGAEWTRAPDKDYGTPFGDFIIDPWMQEAMKKGHQ